MVTTGDAKILELSAYKEVMLTQCTSSCVVMVTNVGIIVNV